MITRAILFSTIAISAVAQGWERSDPTDPLRGESYAQFRLAGTFLKAPANGSLDQPALVVRCVPGMHRRVFNGAFKEAYIAVGAVLNSTVAERDGLVSGTTHPTVIKVSYRLDGDKLKEGQWSPGTDGTAAFFGLPTLNELLFGHAIPHKAGTPNVTTKVLIGIDEYLAGEIVMEFEMPDPTPVGELCGSVYHRK